MKVKIGLIIAVIISVIAGFLIIQSFKNKPYEFAEKQASEQSSFENTKVSDSVGVPDSYGLDLYCANQIFQKLDTALAIYYQKHREFPSTKGKYFLSSVLDYIPALKEEIAYLYCDTAISTGSNKTWMHVDSLEILKSNEIWKRKVFLGNGIPSSPILYFPPSANKKKYILYWVGKNRIDELGKGDDIVYKQKDN